MTELRVVHTADLTPPEWTAMRALLDATFNRFTDAAFDNALGGMHTLLLDSGELVGHASVVARRLLHGGRTWRTGYIERAGYDLGALGASPAGAKLYAARGWQPWRGPLSALTPDGIQRTADKDGAIWVLPVSAPVDLAGELVADWRPGSLW